MKRLATATAALLATTALANAGGIERNTQSPAMLFEEGTYVELSYTYADPEVTGVQTIPAGPTSPAGSQSGDVIPSFNHASLSFRTDITEQLSFALIFDEPVGAIVDYSGLGLAPGYLYRAGSGSQAEINSRQVTAALRYEFDNGFSVYGGLRGVTADGNVSLFNGSGGGTTNYQMDAQGSDELGYMVGAAYERPDIALRVSLTYYSETTHDFSATESSGALGVNATTFETTIPQQLLLEAQSGVAEGTLVFGSIRWTDWTEFDISPTNYSTITGGGSLVSYDNDTFTYTIGGARVLNDNWTVLGALTYEAQQDGFSGNLGPTDGLTSLGVAARYTQGPLRVQAGVSYSWIGEAQTEAPSALPVPPGTQFANFADNNAIGFNLRVGYSF